VLSKKDYFSSSAAYASVNNAVSVFDEENYDEDEETPNDTKSTDDSAIKNLSSGDTGCLIVFMFVLAFVPFLITFWLSPCYFFPQPILLNIL
jgi:hypothetical protein